MALWNFVLFFQSADIITSHIPLSDITNHSWALSLFPFCSSIPPNIHHSSLPCPACWPNPCKTDERRVRRPLEFVWTASSSSMLIEKAENSQNTWNPQMSGGRWWQVMITLEEGIMWLSQEEGQPPLVADCHVCCHTPAHPFKGFAGFGKCMNFFFFLNIS